jgi:hypothetical protein
VQGKAINLLLLGGGGGGDGGVYCFGGSQELPDRPSSIDSREKLK